MLGGLLCVAVGNANSECRVEVYDHIFPPARSTRVRAELKVSYPSQFLPAQVLGGKEE